MNTTKPAPKRSAFFANSASPATAKRPMHRAPAILDPGQAATARSIFHAQFTNASDDNLFSGAVSNLSQPMQDKLSLSPSDTPDRIRNNFAAKIPTLDSTDLTEIWQAIVKYLSDKTHTGNIGLATNTAKTLFPNLAQACGVS